MFLHVYISCIYIIFCHLLISVCDTVYIFFTVSVFTIFYFFVCCAQYNFKFLPSNLVALCHQPCSNFASFWASFSFWTNHGLVCTLIFPISCLFSLSYPFFCSTSLFTVTYVLYFLLPCSYDFQTWVIVNYLLHLTPCFLFKP